MILPNLIYKVHCTTNFKDGNLPPEYQTFQADKDYENIPGNILLRMTRSDPGAFEVLGYKPKDPEPQTEPALPEISPAAAKLLEEFPIPVEDIEPSGKDGKIVKADVEKYLAE